MVCLMQYKQTHYWTLKRNARRDECKLRRCLNTVWSPFLLFSYSFICSFYISRSEYEWSDFYVLPLFFPISSLSSDRFFIFSTAKVNALCIAYRIVSWMLFTVRSKCYLHFLLNVIKVIAIAIFFNYYLWIPLPILQIT